jgi:hypothetical protein
LSVDPIALIEAAGPKKIGTDHIAEVVNRLCAEDAGEGAEPVQH